MYCEAIMFRNDSTSGLSKSALKDATHEYLIRLAKYLRLKCVEDMSKRQLARLIWWRVTRGKHMSPG